MRLRRVLRLFVLTVFILIVGGVFALVYYGVESHPLVASKAKLTTGDIARAKQLKVKYDPRQLKERETSILKVTEKDLNILIGYMIAQSSQADRVYSQANLEPDVGELLFTVCLPQMPIGSYLNLTASFREVESKPRLHRIAIGRINLRGPFVRPVLFLGSKLAQKMNITQELALALEAVKDVQFRSEEFVLTYEWRADVSKKIAEKGRSLLVSDQDRGRLIEYNAQIARTAGKINEESAPLTIFMSPVFALAQQRSRVNGDPASENRSAILALTMFANGRPITPLVGDQSGEHIVRPKRVTTTLRGRTDLPRHFMISAALVALADSRLSNVVGLFKELDDSMGGSGFSFVDLLADRAGVRFAELSTASAEKAQWVQQRISESSDESVFMPEIGDLNEGMMQKTFKQRYRDTDSATYRAEKQEMERRIDSCKLYYN